MPEMQSTKDLAWKLYSELRDHLEGTPERIDRAPEEGPAIDLICDALGKALDALKTVVR